MSSKTRREFLSLAAALSASSLIYPFARAQEEVASAGNRQMPVAKPLDNHAPESNAIPAASGQPAPLSWERDNPARIPWSTHLLREVTRVLPQLEPARDIAEFYPTYARVGEGMQALMWSEILVLLAFFESAWDPCARYHETGLGNDTVTHLPVYSEGLLQLSYQDLDVYSNLPFDWEKDKSLAPTDCTRTILDPFKNLSAGVVILAAQIQTYQKIVLKKNYYWSTLQDPSIGKHSRVERMKLLAAKWAGAVPSI